MKRFEGVKLTAVLAVSATVLAGCDRKDDWQASSTTTNAPTRVCVDSAGKRVPDDQCPPQGQAVHSGGGGVGNAFLWYYIGSSMANRSYTVPPMGAPVSGGGFIPTAGVAYHAAPGAVSRGGFGGIGRSFGGAGGGE
ncbi:hypothetical protein ACNJUT_21075 [Mycobacterium tuberculosis]